MCKTMSILNVQNYVHYWMWNTKGECAKQCPFWMCKTMFIFWMFKTKSFVEGSKLWSYTQLFWMSKWMCKISSFYRGVYFLCLRMWKSMWMSKKLYQSLVIVILSDFQLKVFTDFWLSSSLLLSSSNNMFSFFVPFLGIRSCFSSLDILTVLEMSFWLQFPLDSWSL